MLGHLMGLHGTSLQHRGCNEAQLLRTVRPHLRNDFKFLCKALGLLRLYLRESPNATWLTLQDHVCTEAILADTSARKALRAFLPWASHDLAPLLERDLERLRGIEPLKVIACDWLAQLCQTKVAVIAEALQRRTRRLSPATIRDLVLSNAHLRSTALRAETVEMTRRENPGSARSARPAHRPVSRRAVFQKGLQLKASGKSWTACAREAIPDEFALDANAATNRLRVGVLRLQKSQEAGSLPVQN
jgi:hypothetical protein